MNRIDDNVTIGDIEIWEITANNSMKGKMGHPFHILEHEEAVMMGQLEVIK